MLKGNCPIITLIYAEEYPIQRMNLEKAVQKIQTGAVLNGPEDHHDVCADDRTTYAWAILRKCSYLKK
jgi:hypothetical protein